MTRRRMVSRERRAKHVPRSPRRCASGSFHTIYKSVSPGPRVVSIQPRRVIELPTDNKDNKERRSITLIIFEMAARKALAGS